MLSLPELFLYSAVLGSFFPDILNFKLSNGVSKIFHRISSENYQQGCHRSGNSEGKMLFLRKFRDIAF